MYSKVSSPVVVRPHDIACLSNDSLASVPVVNYWKDPCGGVTDKALAWLDSEVIRDDVAYVTRASDYKERFDTSKLIFKHLYSATNDAAIYGGYVRDYVTESKHFNDIDIWIRNSKDTSSFLTSLSDDFWITPQHKVHVYQTATPCIQMKYLLDHKRSGTPMEIDVVTDCEFTNIGVDFTANALYLERTPEQGGIKLIARPNPRVEYAFETILDHIRYRRIVTSCLASFRNNKHFEERVSKLISIGFTC